MWREVANRHGAMTRWSFCADPGCASPSRHSFAVRGDGDATAKWISDELPGALAQALASAERTRVPVTVRIHAVILGPSSGGRRPTTQSPNQMIGEVIINGVARPLHSTTSYDSMARPSAR
jgi:hypothetical protein